MAKPIVMEWKLTTRARVEHAWRELSDTDRFNKIAQAGFTFTTVEGENGPASNRGSIKKLGLTIQWTEHPFRYRAPHWFSIEREFEGGPAERLIARARLTSKGEAGTEIDYRLEIVPRGMLTSAVLNFDLNRSTRPNVDRALTQLVSLLDTSSVFEQYRGVEPPLTEAGEAFLGKAARRLPQDALSGRLVSFLRAGPMREQARISAAKLGEAWGVEMETIIDLLLHAVDVGMLTLSLDLLCPACQVPRAALAPRVDEVHCEQCGIGYDAIFPECVAVHFRPSREIREPNVKIECIGSPAQSPHIVAQDIVSPGEEVDLVTELPPGIYRLRTLPAIGEPALIEVVAMSAPRKAAFRCADSIEPSAAIVNWPDAILFTNATARPLTVLLERAEPPQAVLTAGRLYADFPRFRDLTPVLPFFSHVELYKAAVLSVTSLEEAAWPVRSSLTRAKLVYTSASWTIAVYPKLGDLLDDAVDAGFFSPTHPRRSFGGITHGTVFDYPRDGRPVPMGSAVDESFAVMQASGFGLLAMPGRIAEDPTFGLELQTRNMSATPHHCRTANGTELVVLGR